MKNLNRILRLTQLQKPHQRLLFHTTSIPLQPDIQRHSPSVNNNLTFAMSYQKKEENFKKLEEELRNLEAIAINDFLAAVKDETSESRTEKIKKELEFIKKIEANPEKVTRKIEKELGAESILHYAAYNSDFSLFEAYMEINKEKSIRLLSKRDSSNNTPLSALASGLEIQNNILDEGENMDNQIISEATKIFKLISSIKEVNWKEDLNRREFNFIEMVDEFNPHLAALLNSRIS